LLDKSLLRKDRARIFMHPLVHQLAALRLDDADREATFRAHALYFNRMLAHLQPAVENGNREALQQVENDFENCRIAWRWSWEHSAKALQQTATTIEYFCDYRGRFEQGLGLLREAVDSPVGKSDKYISSLLLRKVAQLEYRLDRYAEAQQTAQYALDDANASDNKEAKVKCLNVLGTCCLQLGRLQDARNFFAQSLREASADSVPHREAVVLDHLALVEKGLAHYDEALRLSLQSLAKHRQIGDFAGEALCLNNLGDLYLVMQQYEPAAEQFRAGLAICDTHGLTNTRGSLLLNLAEVALKSNNLEAAQDYGQRALEVAEVSGYRALVCWTKLLLTRLALRQAETAAARRELASAVELAISLGRPSLQIASISCFADLLEHHGDAQSARYVLSLAAHYPAIRPADRDEVLRQLSRLPPGADPTPASPKITLDELLHRVVVETDVGYSSLTAYLRKSFDTTVSA
ncbi:MAG: tetratricopeptide repeat protein, partial [Burkholderiaceae bacterium]